jgi:hypothetical protein
MNSEFRMFFMFSFGEEKSAAVTFKDVFSALSQMLLQGNFVRIPFEL